MRNLIFTVILLMGSLGAFAQTITKVDTSAKSVKYTQPVLINNEGSKMVKTIDAEGNIRVSPEFSSFYRVINIGHFVETIRSRGPLTVFAPDNAAFAKISPGRLDSLLMSTRGPDLIAMLSYHVIPGVLKAKDIINQINANKGTATFTTLTGNKLTAKLDANRNIVLIDEQGGQSVISKFDIQQDNGVMHFVTAVLFPKFKEI